MSPRKNRSRTQELLELISKSNKGDNQEQKFQLKQIKKLLKEQNKLLKDLYKLIDERLE